MERIESALCETLGHEILQPLHPEKMVFLKAYNLGKLESRDSSRLRWRSATS